MNDALHASTQRLAEARERGDADDIAEVLVVHANDLLRSGRIDDARTELDEAASIHRSRGRIHDEARCTQFAGTLCRLQGQLDDARSRCMLALALCDSKGPIAVSAYSELGEIALGQGIAADAANAYSAALEAGDATGLLDPARAALLRKRAVALTAASRYPEAILDLQTAHALLTRTGDHAGANRVLIEEATAFRHSGLVADAERIVNRAMGPAKRQRDHAVLADLHLLLAAGALDRRDPAAAMSSAQDARAESLAANAPTSYIGAAHVIAQLAESAGDRLAAYETLVTGWATLGDLLGSDLARMSFEPKLKEMRESWGAEAFEEVKKTYEARRREAPISRNPDAVGEFEKGITKRIKPRS